MRRRAFFLALMVLTIAPPVLAQAPRPAPAVPTPPQSAARPPASGGDSAPGIPPAPYEPQLLRLAEIMGALTLLRDLCGQKDGALWRRRMEDLLAAESDTSGRKDRLAGAYNRGLRDYETSYRVCTPAARTAIDDMITEGASLSLSVTSRYGN